MGGFKNQNYRAKVISDIGYGYKDVRHIYYGNESVSDIDVFIVTDENGNEHYRICEDSSWEGSESIIDTLFYLKHYGCFNKPIIKKMLESIKPEEIDRDIMENLFKN